MTKGGPQYTVDNSCDFIKRFDLVHIGGGKIIVVQWTPPHKFN
jgi:hypothetical protein